MLAKTAKADLDALRKGGYAPTDEEIIQLNDLAIRIESGKDITPQNAPRFAFAGNTILYEPTIMSELWWVDYGRDAFIDDKWKLYCYFFMLYNARNKELSKLVEENEIKKAVKKWVKETTATDNELWRALMWVKYGNEQAHEKENNLIRTSLDDEEIRKSLWMTLIGCSGSIGIPTEELETRTRSELNYMLVQANLMARIPMKPSVARDYIAYRQILKQIEDRGSKNG